ncbi:scavenger receptor class B member 1-like [Epargyreus clarus]|uniref:scavenger receptor class B member 1-like n=1 Tax=Epargyreus clarus TaxID=520877 RepID=UPI003C2E9439
MKDLVQIWSRVTGRQYTNVNSGERELGDLSHNRLKKADYDTSAFEANFSECEELNSKFTDDIDFNERKDAIINRLFEKRKKGQVARQPKCLFIFLMLGFFALGAGFFTLFLHPYDFLFKQKIVLQDGGEIFELWRKPEIELYTRIYLFNITNAEAYMAGNDSKIKLEEVGPYVYREALEHNVTSFNENGTLSAIPMHPLTWVEELSEGHKEDDMLFLPNIALLSIANVVSQQSFMARFGLNNLIGLTNSQPLARMTAREFMMGYKSELMTLGNTFMPGWIYFDKLGLIDRMYDFNGDFETIFTGENDVQLAGLIDTYKGSTDLPQWEGKHCSNVQYASDGTKFKGGVERNETILFFRKSLCRAAPLIPVKEGMKNGLKGYMYTFPEHMLDNGKVYEENKCFCRHGKCLPEGLIDVTDCYYGFPIALSYPHFYKGDDILFSKVEGLRPNQEEHETRMWIQPDSGLPLDVSAKIQINMALGDIAAIKNTARFADMYLPMLWFDIRMYQLPSGMEQRFKMYLNILPLVERAAMYISFMVGTILILVTIYILTFKIMFKSCNGQKTQCNMNFRSNMWIEKEKNTQNKRSNKDSIYAPCEVPLNESESDSSDEKLKKPFIKSHSDRIKQLSHLLTGKFSDSVGNMKGKVKDEITQTKNNMSDRKNSLIPPHIEEETNDAYKSDSGNSYQSVTQDSEDECKYLEVVDDGSEFETYHPKNENRRSKQLQKLDEPKNELYID